MVNGSFRLPLPALNIVLFLPQNLPAGTDCVGSLKLTYISKVTRNITTESYLTQ